MLQLKKFPDIPDSTREEARESRPHPDEPRFCLLAREEGSFPCVVGKEFPASVASQEEALSTEKPRGTPGSCHHAQSPPDVSVYYRETCFPPHCLDFQAEDRLTPRWHVGQPCGKASRESHRCLDPREGKRDTAATAREETARACPLSRRGLTPLGRFQKYPKIHVSTGEESSGSGTDSTQGLRHQHRREMNPERPRSTRLGTGLS